MKPTVVGAGVLVPVVLLLASCGLLFAPMEERANPLDPKAQLVVLDLAPKLQGVVVSTLDDTTLWVSDTQCALIRFDLSALPARVTVAELILDWDYLVAQTVSVYPIRVDWSADVALSEMVPGNFYAATAAASATIDSVGPGVWNLTSVIGTLGFGVLVKGDKSGFVQFYSTYANSARGPKLHVEGYND
jgi:hypothetical protein